MQKITEYYGILRKIIKNYGTLHKITEHYGILRQYCGILRKITEYYVKLRKTYIIIRRIAGQGSGIVAPEIIYKVVYTIGDIIGMDYIQSCFY